MAVAGLTLLELFDDAFVHLIRSQGGSIMRGGRRDGAFHRRTRRRVRATSANAGAGSIHELMHLSTHSRPRIDGLLSRFFRGRDEAANRGGDVRIGGRPFEFRGARIGSSLRKPPARGVASKGGCASFVRTCG